MQNFAFLECCDCFSSLTQLEGHQKVVRGIALPSGSDHKLYTGSKDETLRIWDLLLRGR